MVDERFVPSFAVYFSRKSLEELCNILQDCGDESAEQALNYIKEKHLFFGKTYVKRMEKRLEFLKQGVGSKGEKPFE